ncbi:MAG: ABC transporter ATP-binding protein [Coriobacteriales bacterium]|jgi:iron complex transport system ATP-binding protein
MVMAKLNREMLVARDVQFSWGENRVLDGLNMTVRKGEAVCLMGMNGCGKSTFLDCVLGEHELERGSIQIEGRDSGSLGARERAQLVSYVPQSHERTFPYLVRHMVEMGRTPYRDSFGGAGAGDEEIVNETMERCGISHLAERPCTELSGGEMQMVLLARALVQDTPIIILDEPTAHLDMRNELVFLETIENMVADGKKTVLMATHSPDHAYHLHDAGVDVKVALMAHGKVSRFGAPGEVFDGESLAECFGVRACVGEFSSEESGGRRFKRILAFGAISGGDSKHAGSDDESVRSAKGSMGKGLNSTGNGSSSVGKGSNNSNGGGGGAGKAGPNVGSSTSNDRIEDSRESK